MSDGVMSLAPDFEVASRDQWMELVEDVLRGAPFDKKLVWTTYDGIRVEPLYTGADHGGDQSLPGVIPFSRGSRAQGGAWEVRQAHSAATGNEAILADLQGGVDAIELHVDGAGSVDELDGLLRGVDKAVPVMLAPGSEAADALVGWWEHQGWHGGDVRGGFGADAAHPGVAGVVLRAQGYRGVLAAVVNGARLADRGASEAQELAGSLADGVAYLRSCQEAGINLDEAAAKLEFRYAAGVDQFLTVAKFRAARRLWARVMEACGVAPVGQQQYAVTAGTMMSRRDPWVNMIRTTVACFGAAVGGANAIGVSPFDAAIGVPDALGLRVARNTQLLLREESHVHRVIDPAGGSYYVESLTDALAQKAWGLFQELEAGGSLAERIATVSEARRRDVATRRHPLTGVSEFADLDEAPVERPAALVDLELSRLAEPFEGLRDAADAAPVRPKVFLANLGSAAVHTPRASFAANLLAAGGVESVGGDGSGTPDQVADAWVESGTAMAVVCSSDEMYAEQAADVVSALKSRGCGYVWLAGRPDDRWGADGYIYLGCDALGALGTVHERLGL